MKEIANECACFIHYCNVNISWAQKQLVVQILHLGANKPLQQERAQWEEGGERVLINLFPLHFETFYFYLDAKFFTSATCKLYSNILTFFSPFLAFPLHILCGIEIANKNINKVWKLTTVVFAIIQLIFALR